MKPLDERAADYMEKFSLGLLLAAFVGNVPPYARVIFMIAALLSAAAMVAISQSRKEGQP